MTTINHCAQRRTGSGLRKPRVMILLADYPQIGQTQIKNEIEALEQDYEIGIVTRAISQTRYANHRPHGLARTMEEFVAHVRAFRPDVLHAHYLSELAFLGELSRRTDVPFTVRTHSTDTIGLRKQGLKGRIRQIIRRQPLLENAPWFRRALQAVESELCLGVLALPCARPWLQRAGMRANKLIDCFPVVRIAHFDDRSPNGDAVMNIGFFTPERAMPDFLRLARKVPGRQFNLYTMGPNADRLQMQSAATGTGVNFLGPAEPEAMPAEYKKHRWLVYTADLGDPAIGWPTAIAEAQAAGVGVCLPNLRPDLAQYVGEGAGILYDSIDELPAIAAAPVPDEMRERGFLQSRKSDIEGHKHLLTDLWDKALCGRTPDYRTLELSSPPVQRVATTSLASSA